MCEEVKGKDFQEKDIIENYMILQADINLQKERLFDLDNPEHNFDFNTTREILEKELSKSEKYTHKRITDGTVINIMFKEMGYQEQYDAIQYYFDTDVKGHTNSKIRLREYQLCVKNTEIIHNIREISKEDYEVEKNEKFIIQYDTYKGKGKTIMPQKKPFITLAQAKEIAADIPTPFHLYDEKGIRENARRVNAAFSWNKGFKEYFAVKATPNPYLLKILQEEGCGVDCSSYTELLMSEACGFKGGDIMFSSNDTPAQDMKKAYDLGAYINLDDLTLVDYLERSIGHVPEKICCRYNPGGVFTLGETREGFQVMDNPGDAKYGMSEDQMAEAYTKLMAAGAEQFGIHSFLASNTVTDDYYPKLAGILFELAVRLHKRTGAKIKFINLSGGVGIAYRPDQRSNDIAAIGEGVRKKFEEILVPAGMGDVAIFTEMGRFMLAPYGALVTTVLHQKHIYKEYIGVDACAANLMRPAMYGSYHHITVLGKEDTPCDHKYDVTGGLCENNDKFAIDRMLPEIDIGDIVYIHDTGAHGFSMGYNYNGKLRSAEVLLKEDGSHQLIRRAETPEDYFATFDFSPFFKK